MDDDFLDGIDEAFQRLMKLNGNGKRNGVSSRSKEDRLLMEIVDHLRNLSRSQQEEVLKFVRSLEQPKVD
jgi:GTP1/Obg family GTP-binding protein